MAEQPHYVPNHITHTCGCENIWLDPLKTELIAGNGGTERFPLIQASSNGQYLFQDSKSFSQYVAFSHVRSQGLGNSSNNSLPRCQLSLLQNLANRLYKSDAWPVPFWIDTICVPLQGTGRREAISQMSLIYKNADQVLVLDTSLYNLASSSAQESLSRIRASTWCKRLWTLLEGALARSLRFQLLNYAPLLEDLLNAIQHPVRLPDHRDTPTDQIYSSSFPKALEQLANDYKAAYGLQLGGTESELSFRKEVESAVDEEQILAILRLGCLSIPRFRKLSEAHESEKFSDVDHLIEETYPRLNDQAGQQCATGRSLLQRLQTLSNSGEALALLSPRIGESITGLGSKF